MIYMELFNAMDGNLSMSNRKKLLAAFEAEIRKDAAATVRGMAPKYLDDATDAAIFHALDAAAAAITKPDKDNE